MNVTFWNYTSLTLVIIGAVNWGLVGFFRFDLVSFLFGNMSWLSRVIYALVGLARAVPSERVRKNRKCKITLKQDRAQSLSCHLLNVPY